MMTNNSTEDKEEKRRKAALSYFFITTKPKPITHVLINPKTNTIPLKERSSSSYYYNHPNNKSF